MSERRTLRQIFLSGFRSETEVRNAYNDFVGVVFEEFFKVVGALLLLSALQLALSGQESLFGRVILGVGKFVLAFKIQAISQSIFSESMFDVIRSNNKTRGAIAGTAATAIAFLLIIVTFYLISFAVDHLVAEFAHLTNDGSSVKE